MDTRYQLCYQSLFGTHEGRMVDQLWAGAPHKSIDDRKAALDQSEIFLDFAESALQDCNEKIVYGLFSIVDLQEKTVICQCVLHGGFQTPDWKVNE